MQADIHPRYEAITATCSCGNKVETRSTLGQDLTIDVCSQCHPFFTGKQKIVDTGGRVDRFNKRFGGRGSSRAAAVEESAPAAAEGSVEEGAAEAEAG
jgi:large subunit ribosomal protein L31